jgi:hypothetical protein
VIETDDVDAARSMGGPIYVVAGLVPIKSAGMGSRDMDPTSIRITCGPIGAQVEVGTSVGRTHPRGWPVAQAFLSLREPYVFPIQFGCDPIAIPVAETTVEFPVITCGERWAAEARLHDRWISLWSSDLRPDQIALVELDLDDIESLTVLFS